MVPSLFQSLYVLFMLGMSFWPKLSEIYHVTEQRVPLQFHYRFCPTLMKITVPILVLLILRLKAQNIINHKPLFLPARTFPAIICSFYLNQCSPRQLTWLKGRAFHVFVFKHIRVRCRHSPGAKIWCIFPFAFFTFTEIHTKKMYRQKPSSLRATNQYFLFLLLSLFET